MKHALALCTSGILFITAFVLLSPPLPARADFVQGIPSCSGGSLQYQPKTLMLRGCGDKTHLVQAIAWMGWGEPHTAGQGILLTCDKKTGVCGEPTYRVVLLFFATVKCDGKLAYTNETYAFIGPKSPFDPDSSEAKNPHFELKCHT